MPNTDRSVIGPQYTDRLGRENQVTCHPEYGTFVVADVRLWRPHRVLESGRQVLVQLERTLPLLFIRGAAGEAILVREVLEWIWKLDGDGRKDLRQKASALGLLYEYSVKVAGWGLWAKADADLLVWNFLACRLGMPQARSAEARALPLWRPVSFDVARQDFVAIRQFAEFCRSLKGPMSWLGEELSRVDTHSSY